MGGEGGFIGKKIGQFSISLTRQTLQKLKWRLLNDDDEDDVERNVDRFDKIIWLVR